MPPWGHHDGRKLHRIYKAAPLGSHLHLNEGGCNDADSRALVRTRGRYRALAASLHAEAPSKVPTRLAPGLHPHCMRCIIRGATSDGARTPAINESDGWCAVPVQTMAGVCSLLRRGLRPPRGMAQEILPGPSVAWGVCTTSENEATGCCMCARRSGSPKSLACRMSLEACPGVSRRPTAGMLPRVPRPAAGVLTDLAVVQTAEEEGEVGQDP
jgi:hypothetical protein